LVSRNQTIPNVKEIKEMTKNVNLPSLEEIENMPEAELLCIIEECLSQSENEEIMRQLTDEHLILADIKLASEGKRDKPPVAKYTSAGFDSVFDSEYGECRKLIRRIQYQLASGDFQPEEHVPISIMDGTNQKERLIVVPGFANEQVLHHAIVRVLLPRFMKGMYQFSCASIPGRGIHYVRKYVGKVIKRDPKNCRYILKMDVRKFFQSIPHHRLKEKLRRIIKEPELRTLIFRVIDSVKEGLPLGFYTSQWLANYYMQDLDHYIKERILDDCARIHPEINPQQTKRHGAVYYFRYMDDMVILGPDKVELHAMKNMLVSILKREYGLYMKDDWQVFEFDHIDPYDGRRKGRPLDFVGFKFYHDKTVIRERTYKKMRKLIHRLVKQGIKNISFHDAAAMLSYYGFIHWSDSKGLYTRDLMPYITLRQLKRIIKLEYKRRGEHTAKSDNKRRNYA
jgi:retron-type reverse transcriptase